MRDVKTSLAYRWFEEVWNNSNRNAIDQLLTTDVITNGIDTKNQSGIEGFKTFYDNFRMDFSNVWVVVEDVISQDDTESARCTVTATHNNSGKSVTFSGNATIKVRDGKIAEAWNNFDFLTMYLQLGYALHASQSLEHETQDASM